MTTVEINAIETDQPADTTTAAQAKFKLEFAVFLISCNRLEEASTLLEQGFDLIDQLIEAGH